MRTEHELCIELFSSPVARQLSFPDMIYDMIWLQGKSIAERVGEASCSVVWIPCQVHWGHFIQRKLQHDLHKWKLYSNTPHLGLVQWFPNWGAGPPREVQRHCGRGIDDKKHRVKHCKTSACWCCHAHLYFSKIQLLNPFLSVANKVVAISKGGDTRQHRCGH